MPQSQHAILLPAGKAAEASQVSLPGLPKENDASSLYAHLFDNSESTQGRIQVQELPLNAHLPSEERLLLLHVSSSSSTQPENRLASEILLEDENNSASVKGKAYLAYAEPGKDFTLNKDWPALHDLCYGTRLANMRKSDSKDLNIQDLAKQFVDKRDKAYSGNEGKEVKIEDEAEGDWTDEEVEKPREPKKDLDSDNDDEMEDQEANEDDEDEEEEEEEDSEGSYEDESELESDGEDDPRKKALLEMIQAAIMKDGKLDLERWAIFTFSSD